MHRNISRQNPTEVRNEHDDEEVYSRQVDRCYLDPLDSTGTEPRYRALENTLTSAHGHTHAHTKAFLIRATVR